MSTQAIGAEAEDAACNHLQQQDYTILARNFSCKFGEIDIIAQTPSDEIVFVEVRFRTHKNFGGALESITPHKQEKIRRTAEYYLMTHPTIDRACRFDVLALSMKNDDFIIEWLENAFC